MSVWPTIETVLTAVRWNDDGLVPVIAQETGSRRVLMMAWMNRDALRQTLVRGTMVYWSRSRKRLWRKGESSGNTQRLLAIELDCDGDTLLAEVEQQGVGAACHTGRQSCFYRRLSKEHGWQEHEPRLIDPAGLYRRDSRGGDA